MALIEWSKSNIDSGLQIRDSNSHVIQFFFKILNSFRKQATWLGVQHFGSRRRREGSLKVTSSNPGETESSSKSYTEWKGSIESQILTSQDFLSVLQIVLGGVVWKHGVQRVGRRLEVGGRVHRRVQQKNDGDGVEDGHLFVAHQTSVSLSKSRKQQDCLSTSPTERE